MLLNTEKLKQIRREKGWSQELLAKASGLSLRTIQRIEADQRASAESMLAIASALAVSPQLLQSSSDTLSINWTRKMILNNVVAISIISAVIAMLINLAGDIRLFLDPYVLIFLLCFTYAATIVAFGVDGVFKSILGLRCLFSHEIKGGSPAVYLSKIYQSQISFCYGGAVLAVFIGMIAIHGNIDLTNPHDIHRAYAVNLIVLLYATIFCEGIIRPIKAKLTYCDLSS